MPDETFAALKDAIARNSAAVLSLPSAGMLRHHRTRFLGETDEGFWVESAPDDSDLLNALIADGAPVGIAFKAGQQSVTFTAPICARLPGYPVNDTTRVEALLLPFPERLRQQQRREAYRASVPDEGDIALRLWRIPERAVLRDRPSAAQEVAARLADVSVAGIRAVCRPGRDGQPAKLSTQERLRITLTWEGQEILTEGRVVHLDDRPDGNRIAGVQFKKLDKDLEGRQALSALTKLVGYLQREELKRR